jgi:hypothetical protein
MWHQTTSSPSFLLFRFLTYSSSMVKVTVIQMETSHASISKHIKPASVMLPETYSHSIAILR